MPYIGKGPIDRSLGLNEKDTFTGDGSTVAFDLSTIAPSANAIEVFIDNVRQEPGSGKAYTFGVDGSGDLKRITFSAAPANLAEIYVINSLRTQITETPPDNTITSAKIVGNAVTGAKIAMGSDAQGDVLFYGGTDYERLAAGTSGQFLKTQGAGADPIWGTVSTDPTMGGDISGTASNAQIAANAVTSNEIANNAVTGAKISFIDDSVAVTDGHVLVADGTDYNNVAVSGDISITNAGVTAIAAGAVGASEVASTIDLSSKTVTLPAASVTAHVTAYDDLQIRKDIATLALHNAIARDLAANTMGQSFVDTFEDATGIDATTTCSRNANEYVSSIVTTGQTVTIGGNATYSTTDKKIGSGSLYLDGTSGTGLSVPQSGITTGAYTAECWYKQTVRSGTDRIFAVGDDANPPGISCGYNDTNTMNIYGNSNAGGDDYNYTNWSTESTTEWKHIAICRQTDNTTNVYDGGVYRGATSSSYVRTLVDRVMIGFRNSTGGSSADIEFFTGYIDEFRLSDIQRYTTSGFTPSTTAFTPDANTKVLMHMDGANLPDESTLTVNATGNFTSTTQTASGTVSKMTLIIVYKDLSGTASLNTDLVGAISADNGSNYQTVTLASGGTFGTGTKVAIASNVTVSNTGTAPKYKISFANQADDSKETEVHGVALLY